MKIRDDFITNSSSSSFIMVFKDDDKWASYEDFARHCNNMYYDSFYNLIEDLQKYPENTDKENALELLHHCYTCDYKFELLDSLINIKDYKTYQEYNIERCKIEESKEFKENVENYLAQNEEYLNKKKQIEDADLIVQGEIWDSSGGLLEWAIRNGFIEDNFWHNCVMVWNVG